MPHAVQWQLMDQTGLTLPHVGDVVSMDAGGMPIFEILAIDGERALVTDERHAAVQELPLARFRWVGRAAA